MARLTAGIRPKTLRSMMELDAAGFDVWLKFALEIGGHMEKAPRV